MGLTVLSLFKNLGQSTFPLDNLCYIESFVEKIKVSTQINPGVGGYFDETIQFSFTASLKKQTVNSTETLEDNEHILTSNISNGYLNINPIYFNKIASVYNMKGQKIKEKTLQNEVDISNLTTGIYIIQVSKNGYVKTEKFVKI